jgi:hypothetical protein
MWAPGETPCFERKLMKKLTIAIALLIAGLATAGQLRHPSNPLTLGGNKLQTTEHDWPTPTCPPACDQE